MPCALRAALGRGWGLRFANTAQPACSCCEGQNEPGERRVLAMLARCLDQVQEGLVRLHGVALAGFACLASRKVGVVDGCGCGVFQKNRLSSHWQAVARV